jgi:hypothetical protein
MLDDSEDDKKSTQMSFENVAQYNAWLKRKFKI